MGLLRKMFKALQAKPKKQNIRERPKKRNTSKPKMVRFTFAIYEEGEQIEPNRWYQKKSWKNKNFVNYYGPWDSDWKRADEGSAQVAGISRDDRKEDFLNLAPLDTFKMFLESDPENPVNKNARKVMASAEVDGVLVTKQIGYLPDEIANTYAGVDLDIRPAKAYLPKRSDHNVGVEVALLVRSARYLKKRASK